MGVRDYGNDYDAIKYHYQVELRNRFPNACRNKVINDKKRYVKRQLLLQELQPVLHMDVGNHLAVEQIQTIQHGCRRFSTGSRLKP